MVASRPKNGLLRVGAGATLPLFQFGESVIHLVFPLVAKAFIEHEGEDIILIILSGGLAAGYWLRLRVDCLIVIA